MSKIIDAFVLVDTEGLRAAFPAGIGHHRQEGYQIENYFSILVDSDDAYHDEEQDVSRMTGIKCHVNDTIYFRARTRGANNNDVIIIQFADMAAGLPAAQLTSYLSAPMFTTSQTRQGLVYNNNVPAQPFSNSINAKMWTAVTEGATRVDPRMSVQAEQSTSELEHKHIRYTLGFKVSYSDGVVLSYYFDPAIKILD